MMFLDGDFLETFLNIDPKRQTQVLAAVFSKDKEFLQQHGSAVAKDVKALISALKDTH